MIHKKLNAQKHFTHNTSNSSLSSHNYLLLNDSKRSSLIEESKGEKKQSNKNINNIKSINNKFYIKGTLKVDKVHYLMKDDGKKLFEDINLQYIEPLEGGEEEESEEKDDGTYKRYLNNINEELNQKKENIVFIHDLGLSNNLLDVNALFDKIKKKSKFKTRNSFLSVYNRIEKDDINQDNNQQKQKKIVPRRRGLGFKAIQKLFISKNDLKQYYQTRKRVLTYENRKNINRYYKIKNILLNIKERKKVVRKIKSQKIFKKTKRGPVPQTSEDNIFIKKKKIKIKDSLSLLESSKKLSKIIQENKKEEEKKKEKKNEKKEENEIKEKKVAQEKIKSLSPKNKKKKKKITKKNETINKPLNKFPSKYKKYLLDKNKMFKTKKTTSTISINKYNSIGKTKSKLKSPAINSILKDISQLSQSVLTSRFQKNKERKNNTILYEKHFGFEYWKENELMKQLCHNSTTNRKSRGFRSFYSPNKELDTFSIIANNYSWFINKKNFDDILDCETDFTLGIKESSMNPYSIRWTKSMIKNGYNRNIQLKNNNNGVPKIELVRAQSSMPYTNRENVKYDKNKNINEIFRKNNNMFGRIYKNNNGIEFPIIKYL